MGGAASGVWGHGFSVQWCWTGGGGGGSTRTALCIIVAYDSKYVVTKQTPASLKAGLSNAE